MYIDLWTSLFICGNFSALVVPIEGSRTYEYVLGKLLIFNSNLFLIPNSFDTMLKQLSCKLLIVEVNNGKALYVDKGLFI